MLQNKPSKKGGRPAKSLAEKRKYRLSLKLNTNEYLQLKSKSKIAGKNRCDFLRELIYSSEIKQRFTTEQNEIFRQITGMANNLNQLVRLAHIQGVWYVESTAKSFELQASMNPNIKKPVWHISLNFPEKDKDKLTNEQMTQIAETYMKRMNIKSTQYLIVRHHDRKHPHIHLCINRINNDGKLISDKNEKYRSAKICRELTEKYGLYIAPGKENVNRERLIGYDKTKYEIYDALKQAIPKSKTWKDLEKQLKKDGTTFQFKMNGKTDKIQEIIFEKDGIKINGSKVDRECSFSKIDSEIKDNAFRALQQVEQQAQQANSAINAVEALSSLIAQLSIFTAPNSPHYDTTLTEYIQALKARKWAAKNKIRIHRVR